MSGDTHCPECGEPVSATAAYCMHCYADLPSGPAGDDADASGDRGWGDQDNPDPTNENWEDPTAETETGGGFADRSGADPSGSATGTGGTATHTTDRSGGDPLLDPDGIVDNALTIVVAVAGGIVVGVVGTILLVVMTGSGWALPVGLLTWLVATAYLSRRHTVQGAVAHTCYAIAAVLLAFPFVALSPVVEVESLSERGVLFVVFLLSVLIPAAIAGGIGFVASQFVPESRSGG